MALCLFTEPSMGGGRAAPPPHGMLPAVTRRATALRYMTYLAIPSWLVFVFSFLAMTLAASIGALVSRRRPVQIEAREDFGIILAATLTLLGLVIGFSFSMALSRYDQRKNYEEAEANAIGTEYMRADLLPAPDATRIRTLLARYLDQRILFYSVRDDQELRQIEGQTA